MTLAHERSGAGDPIVVLNGFGGTRLDWDPAFLGALAEGHELILVDNRGMGGSGGGDGAFTIEDMAADTIDLVESLGLERPCVLGWSMGGMIAMAYALARPDLAGSLVLLSTQAGAGMRPIPPDVGERLRDLSGTPEERARRLISLLFTPERVPAVEAVALEAMTAAGAALDHGLLARQWDAMEAWNAAGVTGRLREIACPALVGTGTEDLICPAENAALLAAALRDSWLVRFPNSGHAFMADHPVALVGAIAAFLAAQK